MSRNHTFPHLYEVLYKKSVHKLNNKHDVSLLLHVLAYFKAYFVGPLVDE